MTTDRPLLVLAAALTLGLPVAASARDPGRLIVYPSHGSPTAFVARGRFIEDEGDQTPRKRASKLRNAWNTLRTLESDEIKGATLRVVVAREHAFTVQTDDDGVWQVEARLDAPLAPGRQPVIVTAIDDKGHPAPPGRGWLYVLPASPGVAVISDFDDTVVHTGVTSKRQLLKNSLGRNAAQLKVVRGAPATYRAFLQAGARAVFYVSGSPQNFTERVEAFLRKNGLPHGPLFLKNFGKDPTFAQDTFKLGHLRRILAAHPEARFLLVGDSGERDPEIYAQLRGQLPQQVLGIVIRRVEGDSSPPGRFTGMTVVSDFSDTKLLVGLLATNPVE